METYVVPVSCTVYLRRKLTLPAVSSELPRTKQHVCCVAGLGTALVFAIVFWAIRRGEEDCGFRHIMVLSRGMFVSSSIVNSFVQSTTRYDTRYPCLCPICLSNPPRQVRLMNFVCCGRGQKLPAGPPFFTCLRNAAFRGSLATCPDTKTSHSRHKFYIGAFLMFFCNAIIIIKYLTRGKVPANPFVSVRTMVSFAQRVTGCPQVPKTKRRVRLLNGSFRPLGSKYRVLDQITYMSVLTTQGGNITHNPLGKGCR